MLHQFKLQEHYFKIFVIKFTFGLCIKKLGDQLYLYSISTITPYLICFYEQSIGLLQSKDPLDTLWSPKTSTLWRHKRKKPHSDQMVKFIRELQTDLEMVYVGQLCLSWEFLQWQYEKSFEIWESDPYGLRQYNEVAGEFQQFQVLLQRFIENEPFQGPRVENYVKNRWVMRNLLLQVPVIRGEHTREFPRF